MSVISRERRHRWVTDQLARFPHLTASQRRFLWAPLMESGWHLLVGHAAAPPGRATAFAIGRTGAYALVFTDTLPGRAALQRVRIHADEVFGGLQQPRSQFVPHMLEIVLLMDRAVPAEAHDPFLTADEPTLRSTLFSGPPTLSPVRARALATSVASRAAGYEWLSGNDAPVEEAPATVGLFGTGTLREDARTRALSRSFREWETFLDPEQITLVNTGFNGPARITGPAGTGKSVVALHRMARFAKTAPDRLLFTSFVRTLPAYHESGFAQLAPRARDRAEFLGLHAWTIRFLRYREVPHTLPRQDQNPCENAFARAWKKARRSLGHIPDTGYPYWKDEVDRVIKGRRITSLDHYLTIKRPGRDRVRLDRARRTAVWEEFYQPYEQLLREKGFDDFNDLIHKAIDELRVRPLDKSEEYGLVVVDEVQDFTLSELGLAHEIAGGTPDAQLLLVGDGQQQVYAGGWKLSDAGIPLRGRGRVLRTNYRNRAAILCYIQRIQARDTVDDLDGSPGFAVSDSSAVLPGGTVIEKLLPRTAVDTELVRAIADSGFANSDADIAVLVATRSDVRHYRNILEQAGFESRPLERYRGHQHDGVITVGTVHRSKGMDFAAVFHIVDEADLQSKGLTGGARDRAELRARQHLVAASRARDFLWLAKVSGNANGRHHCAPRTMKALPTRGPGRAHHL